MPSAAGRNRVEVSAPHRFLGWRGGSRYFWGTRRAVKCIQRRRKQHRGEGRDGAFVPRAGVVFLDGRGHN